MVRIDLYPDLSHCVETQARREYSETMKKLLVAEESSGELQQRLELLHSFLEQTDFRELRRQSEKHLVEGKQVKFTVYSEAGDPRYSMQVE
jgi:hypothetical protein